MNIYDVPLGPAHSKREVIQYDGEGRRYGGEDRRYGGEDRQYDGEDRQYDGEARQEHCKYQLMSKTSSIIGI